MNLVNLALAVLMVGASIHQGSLLGAAFGVGAGVYLFLAFEKEDDDGE